jgi:hypothetical protein
MMDVDDFKKLNDTYGHLVGDRVLKAISNVVKAQMRGVDTAARYGGEEIAVILPRTEMVGAYALAERIREAVAELRVTTDDEPPKVLGVTASLGCAAFPESKATWCGAPTARSIAPRRPARTASSCSGATTANRIGSRRSTSWCRERAAPGRAQGRVRAAVRACEASADDRSDALGRGRPRGR